MYVLFRPILLTGPLEISQFECLGNDNLGQCEVKNYPKMPSPLQLTPIPFSKMQVNCHLLQEMISYFSITSPICLL